MTVPQITTPQFADQLAAGITSRDNTTDTGIGPVSDVVIQPVAQVLEQQNNRLRQVSQLISLQNLSQFSTSDLDALVYNEGLIRNPGSQATGDVVFSRATRPSTDVPVQRGFPIASAADESTGASITFVTSEARTLPAASASSYFNITTGRYELSVPVIALVSGPVGLLGPNRLNRPLKPLVNFDSVSNPVAITEGGIVPEVNTALGARYQISVEGRQLSTPTGITKYVEDNFPGVAGINTVYGNNPLLTRSGTDAGAVDAFVVAPSTTQQVETFTFLGTGQLIPVSFPPLVSVVSVLFGAATLVQGTDYNVVFDTSGVSGSTRDSDGIVILASSSAGLVAGSSQLVVTYTYNTLVRDLQSAEDQEDVHVFGRDLLYRAGVATPIVITANVTVASGFNPTTVIGFAATAIQGYIAGLPNAGLGALVEQFGVETAAGSVSGVSNFAITRMSLASEPSGISDIPLIGSQYPTLSVANLILTPI